MKTTIYINTVLLNKLKKVSEAIDVSKNELVSRLLSKIISNNSFAPKPNKSVRYQHSYPDVVWKKEHIKLEPVFYEKALDLRRNFKFSVSWLISFAIVHYLDEIVKELTGPENSEKIQDNYHRNFVYIAKIVDGIHVFTTMLGVPEQKHLEKLML